MSNLHFALFEAIGFETTKPCKPDNTCLWEPGNMFICLTSERETSTKTLLIFLKCWGETEILFFMGLLTILTLYKLLLHTVCLKLGMENLII